MIFVTVVGGLGASVANLSHHQGVAQTRTVDKGVSTQMAESGLADIYDQITRQVQDDETYPTSIAPTNVTVTCEGVEKTIGNYTARVIDVQKSDSPTADGGRLVTYEFTVEGTGTAPGNVTSVVQAKFTGSITKAPRIVLGSDEERSSNLYTPPGAIVANNRVSIISDGKLRTFDSTGQNLAQLYGRNGVSWDVQTGKKDDNRATDVINVQGRISVPSTAYQYTVGTSGIANKNGVRNWNSNKLSLTDTTLINDPYYKETPLGDVNVVTELDKEGRFNSEADVDDWEQGWVDMITRDPHKTLYNSSKRSSDMPYGWAPQCWQHIDAPGRIRGDFEVNGEIHLMPTSEDPTKNVIYIDGDVINNSTIVNHGVHLVVKGSYADSSGSQYKLSNERSAWRTDDVIKGQASLISLKKADDAIQINNSGTKRVGLIFAAKGGIKVTGKGELHGKLAAGGTGSLGNIELRSRSRETISVIYDKAFDRKRGAFKSTTNVPGSNSDGGYVVTRPFAPSLVNSWKQTK